MFEAFEHWLAGARETERCERVRLCAKGLMKVFPREFVETYLFARDKENEDPRVSKAVSLTYALDAHITGLGGVSNVLQMDHPWHENWETYNWTFFTHHVKFGAEGAQAPNADIKTG